MEIRERKSEKARESAKKRWEKPQDDAEIMRTHKVDHANASKTDASKGKESKRNIYTPEFEEFWSIYPRKKEKPKAFKCWNTRLKEGETEILITLCAKNYAAEVKVKGTEEQYIKLPATFLGPNKPYEDYKQSRTSPPKINSFDYQVALQRHIENGGDPSEFRYPN